MSGGSLEYFYLKMEDVRGLIRDQGHTEFEGLIKTLLKTFEKLLYELEWWYSGDTSESRFVQACMEESAVIKKFGDDWKREADRLFRFITDLKDLKKERIK